MDAHSIDHPRNAVFGSSERAARRRLDPIDPAAPRFSTHLCRNPLGGRGRRQPDVDIVTGADPWAKFLAIVWPGVTEPGDPVGLGSSLPRRASVGGHHSTA
jgi:hypothetical protein